MISKKNLFFRRFIASHYITKTILTLPSFGPGSVLFPPHLTMSHQRFHIFCAHFRTKHGSCAKVESGVTHIARVHISSVLHPGFSYGLCCTPFKGAMINTTVLMGYCFQPFAKQRIPLTTPLRPNVERISRNFSGPWCALLQNTSLCNLSKQMKILFSCPERPTPVFCSTNLRDSVWKARSDGGRTVHRHTSGGRPHLRCSVHRATLLISELSFWFGLRI